MRIHSVSGRHSPQYKTFPLSLTNGKYNLASETQGYTYKTQTLGNIKLMKIHANERSSLMQGFGAGAAWSLWYLAGAGAVTLARLRLQLLLQF